MAAKRISMEFIEESTSTDKDKVLVHFNGIMDKYLKENGKKEQKMVMGHGNHPKEIFIKVNGT